MKRIAPFALILIAGISQTRAEDAADIRPGLWEIQHNTSMDGQKMPDVNQMMAQVPPEMRQQVQAMMAQQGAGMTSKGVTICITPEQAADHDYGADDQDGKCKVTDIQHDGKTTTMKMQCTDPKGEGETTVTRHSSEAWTSVTKMTMEQDGGQHSMTSEAKAHWVGADCGAVRAADSQSSGKKHKSAP